MLWLLLFFCTPTMLFFTMEESGGGLGYILHTLQPLELTFTVCCTVTRLLSYTAPAISRCLPWRD